MTTEEKRIEVEHIKSEASSPKSRLIQLHSELMDIGAVREANSLGTIIGRLEEWQNR